MNHFYLIWFLSLTLFLSSCGDEENVTNKIVLASVNGVELTQSALLYHLPDGLSVEDSLAFAENYIKQWVEEQVVYQKAQEVLPQDAQNVDYQLEDYKRSLLIYSYETYYIQDRLDTIVPFEEIKAYYDDHQDDFILKDYLVKAVYAKYTDITPELDKVKSWYKFYKPEDWISFQSHANLYSVTYFNDTTNWVLFDDVLKEIPLTDINTASFIQKKKSITFEEEGMVYFLNIIDARLQDEVSPIEFEKDRIRGILLNIRMNELRKELKSELYNDAKNADIIKIF